ncbi:hypothetical protein BC6307_10235 [Sutcliffiella cohnii]|uniref:YprB ribonuclease H-like domain-containing protein n=1 Tax=Sutcliffiella cohnii TaxID=33932 RepID=A0A223KQ51_9BACI|nr:ribonuclease H-like domain-containing protein [Sutcliffiella cohnii]AST91631.1 hypothetical protein BC6307_10235 [Sutcliffiella cohnii]
MKLKNKLNRLKKHMSHEPVSNEQKGVQSKERIDDEYLQEWLQYDTKPYFYENEYCLIREVQYSLNFKHGLYSLGELKNVVEKWNNSNIEHPLSSKGHQTSDLFFFDTETTGLSGGAGTTIFLLGYARVYDDKVVVRQHILPSPGNEIALYESFLKNVDYTTLVTYNGKAFDWPQVKTRHTLIKEHVPKLPSFGHFDLLHAARRFWKKEMDSVRLSLVEKEKLQIHREGDTPGFLAPMIYFDFVESKNPEGMKGILKHNEWDVLTLITLYIHLSKLLLKEEMPTTENERYEVGRWFDFLGEDEVAVERYELLVNESWKAAYNLGKLKKKMKRNEEAEQHFLQAYHANDNNEKYLAGIELAKLYEHQFKAYEKALFYTEKSYTFYRNSNNKSLKEVNFVKRLERLYKKIEK